jgi:phosphoribosyl 1,2-cyclic phosphate phosphodiesterase
VTPPTESPQALFLGTGTSTGVPLIGCGCAVCTSSDARNNRLRSSLFVSHAGFGLLIDTSPDFRQQALRCALPRVDAVLVTHGHTDHIFGMDDIRRFNTLQRCRIPVYASAFTIGTLTRVFDYFHGPSLEGTYLPQVDFVALEGPRPIGPFQVTPFDVEHGRDPTWGYRIDVEGHSLGYAPDCFRFPAAAYEAVRGVGTMVLDALRHTPHVSHMTVADSVTTLQAIGARQSYLTHLGHDLDYAKLATHLPSGVEPAYDGLRIAW